MIRLIYIDPKNRGEMRRLFDLVTATAAKLEERNDDSVREKLGNEAAYVASKEPNRDVDESDVVDGALEALLSWRDVAGAEATMYRFEADYEVLYFHGPGARIVGVFERLLNEAGPT